MGAPRPEAAGCSAEKCGLQGPPGEGPGEALLPAGQARASRRLTEDAGSRRPLAGGRARTRDAARGWTQVRDAAERCGTRPTRDRPRRWRGSSGRPGSGAAGGGHTGRSRITRGLARHAVPSCG